MHDFWSRIYSAPRVPTLTPSNYRASEPPEWDEVFFTIRKMARGKATGPDRVSAEILQAGETAATEMTFRLVTDIWMTKRVPQEMGEALIVLLPKDRYRPKEPSQQRPISLTNAWFKVLDKILADRISTHFERHIILSEP